MSFRVATFNCRDFFDDALPNVIGHLDREGFGIWAQRRARSLYGRKLDAVAEVVSRSGADVIAFQEIEGARVLEDLRAQLPQAGFQPAVAGASDSRGIACGVLSKFPIVSVEVHGAGELAFPGFVDGDPRPFGGRLVSKRGVLEVTVGLPDGTNMVLLVVHLKSARPVRRVDLAGEPSDDPGHYAAAEGSARALVMRMAEALFLRSRVDALFARDSRTQLAVLGDFNDTADSLVVRAVAGDLADPPRGRNSDLDAVTSLENGVLHHCSRAVPPSVRHSIVHRGHPMLFDHVLVSRSLWRRFEGARILNEDLPDSAHEGREDVASDHAAVVASFSG
ncbi:MAG: endonuclease/exonuclease/phosphatase family protein [Myxococcales bacterium]|nr:endonuclease/exonuclease/phosphatase family protein [Myxococcales bacterium]